RIALVIATPEGHLPASILSPHGTPAADRVALSEERLPVIRIDATSPFDLGAVVDGALDHGVPVSTDVHAVVANCLRGGLAVRWRELHGSDTWSLIEAS